MPTCYMMIGLPGSGRSVAYQELLRKYPDLVVVSTDAILERMAKEQQKSYNEVFMHIDQAQKEMDQQVKDLCAQGKSFIWYQTNLYKETRQRKISSLLAHGYDIVAVVVEITVNEHDRRLEKMHSKGGKYISPQVIFDMRKVYQRPSYEEGFKKIVIVDNDNQPFLLPKG